MKIKNLILKVCILLSIPSFAQEGLAVYSDYLTDNYYLIHPSMAGAANCSKVRLTVRQQWFGNDDAPALQTLSYNGKLGDRGSAAGIILYNDKNGYHKQKGVKLTYAHHLMFSRSTVDLNQLSFGLNVGLNQLQLDESAFNDPSYDPIITGGINSASFFNVDFGASYNYLDFYAHATVKNAVFRSKDIYTDVESDNLRRYLLSAGYTFGNSRKFLIEPSVLFQLTEQTGEKTLDGNVKLYKITDFGKVWGGLSYRRSFDGAEYLDGTQVKTQYLQHITPILGVNYKKFMFAYTYSQIMGNIKFQTGGFHQISLGFDFGCTKDRYDCNCPAVN